MEFFNIIKIIFLLILILGLMYASLYLFKKYFFSSDNTKTKLIKIKVLSTQMVMPKKFIQVVQVHDKVLVLGLSDHSINVLHEFEGFISPENLIEKDIKRIDMKDNFMDILKKNLGMK